MKNNDTIIDAKIGNLYEFTKVLSFKEQVQEHFLVAMPSIASR